ncbi:hypothetical protein KUV50_19270, partial [Membranicola marinus]
DTLKYGAGATITDVSVSYVGVEGTTGTTNYTNFDGQSDYLIIDDEQVGTGKEDVFEVKVTFAVDPAAVTPQSADCELTEGEEGTGLLNVAEVSDGVPSKNDDACADMPNPSVDIVKTVTAGPTSTGNVNEYTMTYQVEVSNTSDALAFYDLSDTLKYGAGATITDVSVSYVGVEGTTGTANYTNFDGQSDYLIIDDEQVGSGKEDVFQIVVTFAVDPAAVTPQSADCELTEGEEGTGLLNTAEVSDGVPSKNDDACADMPNPSVDIVKTVTAGPTSTGNVNEYTMTYQVEVSNTSDALAFYDLSDTLKYGAGATITDVSVSYVSGDGETGTANYTNFDGQSDYLIIDDEQVGTGKEDVFQIVVTFEVDPAAVTPQSANCELTEDEEGTGLLNTAEVSDGVPSKNDDACADMPNPSVDIVKTVTAGPTSTGNVNEYTMTYQVEVSNTSDALAFYDLSDTLK